MASSKKNRGGKMSGKVGRTVTYPLYGEDVMRSIGVRKAPFTKNEIVAQMGMKVVQSFLNIIYPFICVGFEIEARLHRRNPQNVSFAYNRKNAVTGIYPDIGMDFPNVLVSKGDLSPPLNPRAMLSNRKVVFEWDYDPRARRQHWSDQVMVLVYLPEIPDAVFITAGSSRETKTASIDIPNYLTFSRLETYIAFISDDRKQVSNSVYTGPLIP